ncbi:hypothetical protein DLK05_06240 [Ancylomarina longa]|uniref:Uncharacterized protein n=2 Tax=Ancylomarina longa TaxID=2487017 RepID=A0A434AW51_9BACT|nr:hypothetical protein DLK05_06240 [Ancylomarina longa]
MIVPVGYGTYSLWYLLNQHETNPLDQTIILDNKGYLHIRHLEANIFTYNAVDVLTFPAQISNSFNITLPPNLALPTPINIPATADKIQVQTGQSGVILSEMDLNTNMQFTFTNPLNADVDLSITLPDASINGNVVSQTYKILAGATNQVETLDLTGVHLDFNTPYSPNNELDIQFAGQILDNGGTINGSGNLNIQYQVQTIDFILAKGDFGKQNLNIGNGNIDMNVDFWDDIEGDYQFADPKIKLYMQNSAGVPFEINANITGYSTDGNTQALNPAPLQPNYPKTNAEVTSGIADTVIYDKNNSEIVNLMALPPSDRLEYSGSVALNPNAVDIPTSPNIITNNSAIDVDLEIDIPLDFSATNLMIRDTITSIDISDADKIMNAAAVITAKNGFPLAVSIDKIYLADASYNKIDSITDNKVIDAAAVFTSGDQQGEVDESKIQEISHEVQLSQTQIEHLNQTRNIIINASVKTTGNGTEPVKLKGDYELSFTISVQAQIDVNN